MTIRVTPIIYTNAAKSEPQVIHDYEEVEVENEHDAGFGLARLKLGRQARSNPLNLVHNGHFELRGPYDEIIFEGAYQDSEGDPSASNSGYDVSAVGYKNRLGFKKSAWLPSYPSVTDIASIIRDGINTYVPELVVTTETCPNTGKTIVYEPEGQASSVSEHLAALKSYGSTNFRPLKFFVWEGRKFYLKEKPALNNPSYTVSGEFCTGSGIKTNAENFFTKLSVRYSGLLENLIETVNDTDLGLNWRDIYASFFGSYNPAAVGVQFIREADIVDITSHGRISDTQAREVGKTLLNNVCGEGIRTVIQQVNIKDHQAVRYSHNNQVCPLYLIRPGFVLNMTNMGAASQATSLEETNIYIAKTNWKLTNKGQELTLTSDDGQDSEDFLSNLLSGVDSITE